MGLDLDLGVAQVPADVWIGDLFGDRQKYNERKQDGQQNRKAAQFLERWRRPPKRLFFFGCNYTSNHES